MVEKVSDQVIKQSRCHEKITEGCWEHLLPFWAGDFEADFYQADNLANIDQIKNAENGETLIFILKYNRKLSLCSTFPWPKTIDQVRVLHLYMLYDTRINQIKAKRAIFVKYRFANYVISFSKIGRNWLFI